MRDIAPMDPGSVSVYLDGLSDETKAVLARIDVPDRQKVQLVEDVRTILHLCFERYFKDKD